MMRTQSHRRESGWGRAASRQPRRGMSMIEVMMSLSVLAIVLLALVSANVVASNSTQLSRRRSIMVEFAQSRLEQISAMTRVNIPTGDSGAQTCWQGWMPSNLTCTQIIGPAAGIFLPSASPGTGGWMLDVINGQPPPGTPPAGGPNQGDDLMFGPLLVDGDFSGINRGGSLTDTTGTLYARNTLYNAWANGDLTGCANAIVQTNTNVFCREIHVEAYNVDAGAATYINMLHVWVRVVQGGFGTSTTAWQNSYVMLEQDLSQ